MSGGGVSIQVDFPRQFAGFSGRNPADSRRRPDPGSKAPEDAVDHTAVVHPRHAAYFVRRQLRDDRSFLVGQHVTAHLSGSLFGSLNHDKLRCVNLWGQCLVASCQTGVSTLGWRSPATGVHLTRGLGNRAPRLCEQAACVGADGSAGRTMGGVAIVAKRHL